MSAHCAALRQRREGRRREVDFAAIENRRRREFGIFRLDLVVAEAGREEAQEGRKAGRDGTLEVHPSGGAKGEGGGRAHGRRRSESKREILLKT